MHSLIVSLRAIACLHPYPLFLSTPLPSRQCKSSACQAPPFHLPTSCLKGILDTHPVRSASRPCRRCEAAPSSGTPWGTCPPAAPAHIKDRDSSTLLTVSQHSISIYTALIQHHFSAAAVAQKGPRALLPTRCACIPVTASTNSGPLARLDK